MIVNHMQQSNSVLTTFFLMMMVNPGAQERAQAQIDALLGNTRLPTAEDRPLLPFIDAIFWETLRYSPVLPLCELLRPLVCYCYRISQQFLILPWVRTRMMGSTFQRVMRCGSLNYQAFIDSVFKVLSS